MKEKKPGAVRVASFEVTNLGKEAFRRWLALSDDCRGITNCIWQTWLLWHVQNGSAAKVKADIETFNKWRDGDKKTRGDKPKWIVQAVSKECSKAIYDKLAAEFPNIATDSRELLRNSVQGKISSLKAAKGSLPGWVAILFYNQSLPSTVHGNPIPFSKKNADIEPGDKEKNWKLHLRISRIPPKDGKKVGSTVLEPVELWTKGRKCAGQLAILKKIAAAEWEFCGSNLIWSSSKRKWFAQIAYRMPLQAAMELDSDRVAFLAAAKFETHKPHPWRLRLPEANRWPGGTGQHVVGVRRRLIMERLQRNAGYKFAGSCRKGHGRQKAQDWDWKLQRTWKDFVKTTNYVTCKDVVNQAVSARCGTLVYFQPAGDFRESRFLTRAGKIEGRHDASGWDWAQVGTRLAQLCEVAGIRLVVKKVGDAKPVSLQEKAGKSKPAKRVALHKV